MFFAFCMGLIIVVAMAFGIPIVLSAIGLAAVAVGSTFSVDQISSAFGILLCVVFACVFWSKKERTARGERRKARRDARRRFRRHALLHSR